MNAITPSRRRPIAAPAMTQATPVVADSLLNFVARAMADPTINVDKLEVLLRMQREIVADDARLQFNRAMSTTQAEMQPIVRDASNTQTQSRYARLETIDAKLRPIYTRNGFCLSFDSAPIEGPNVRIVCEVSHSGGHSKTFHLEAALDMAGPQGKANKTPLHGLGSSVSYLRRYLTCMIFHVVLANEDNDGNRSRGDGELGSRSQVDELYALIAECSADPDAAESNERSFLTRMGLAELGSIKEIPASDFPRLRNALLTKKGVLAQRAAAKPAANREARP